MYSQSVWCDYSVGLQGDIWKCLWSAQQHLSAEPKQNVLLFYVQVTHRRESPTLYSFNTQSTRCFLHDWLGTFCLKSSDTTHTSTGHSAMLVLFQLTKHTLLTNALHKPLTHCPCRSCWLVQAVLAWGSWDFTETLSGSWIWGLNRI